jgi:hypothetical protein
MAEWDYPDRLLDEPMLAVGPVGGAVRGGDEFTGPRPAPAERAVGQQGGREGEAASEANQSRHPVVVHGFLAINDAS